jgi:hypothetical protein
MGSQCTSRSMARIGTIRSLQSSLNRSGCGVRPRMKKTRRRPGVPVVDSLNPLDHHLSQDLAAVVQGQCMLMDTLGRHMLTCHREMVPEPLAVTPAASPPTPHLSAAPWAAGPSGDPRTAGRDAAAAVAGGGGGRHNWPPAFAGRLISLGNRCVRTPSDLTSGNPQ